MRKFLFLFALGILVMAVGCTRRTVVNTPEGTITTEQHGNQVTVESKEGKAVIGNVQLTEKDLGVPIYPGATQKSNAGFTATATGKGKSFSMAAFSTKDSVDQVTAFYKSKLPSSSKFTSMNVPGAQMSMFEVKNEGKGIHVQIMADAKSGQTNIMIMTGTEDK